MISIKMLRSLGACLLFCLSIGSASFARAQVSGPPSANCHITDGSFTTCPSGKSEWSDVVPVAFPASDSYLYVNQDATHSFLYLMYDFPIRTTPIAATDSVHVSFYTVEQEAGIPVLIIYDVYIMGNGQMEILQQGKQTPAGRIQSAVAFGTSPNSSTPHVTAELQVPLTAGPPSTYSSDPLYWSASVPPTPPPPPDPPTCPDFVACLKTQSQIDAWNQEANADYDQAEADYTSLLMDCDQFGQQAQSSTAAFAQASLESAANIYAAQLKTVASAAQQLVTLLQQHPPSGGPTIGQILQTVSQTAVPSVLQAASALENLAAMAPLDLDDPTFYLKVNLGALIISQGLAKAALGAAELAVTAAEGASALVAAEVAPLAVAIGAAIAAFEVGVALEVALAEAVAAVAQAVSAACQDAVTLVVAPEFAKAEFYFTLAQDPPDSNFTVIPTPVVPKLPGQPLTTATGFSSQVVKDLNAIISNNEQEMALLQVIPVAVNRVAGAVAAGDQTSRANQANAVRLFSSELVPLTNSEASLRAALANDLAADGLNSTFTSTTVFNLLGPLQNGLPSSITTALGQLGLDASTQTSILKAVSAVDPNVIATLGNGALPAALADPSFSAADAASVAALNSLATPPPTSALTNSVSFTIPGDYSSAGVGLRGQTSGDIKLTDLPVGASVLKAYLYYAFLDNGLEAPLSQIVLNGTPINGTVIGLGPDTCWGRTNSFTFRADVTPYVSGNGTYALTGVASGGAILAEGASLVVVYQLTGAPTKTIMIDDGNLSMPNGTSFGTASFGNFTAASPVSATTAFIVGDGQATSFGATPTTFTGSAGTINIPNLFASLDGLYWDDASVDVSKAIGAGSDTGSAKITITGDCLLWSAQAFSVTSALTAAPLTATAGVVQAGASGDTVVNLRGLAPSDAPTLEDQVLAIVQFRIIQNPSLSASVLTGQLLSGLVADGVIPPSEASTIEANVATRLVIPSASAPATVATTTTLTINPNANLITGEPITLTAVVKPVSGTAIPTGSVTFDDPMVGTIAVPLDSTGTAVYKTVVPAPGNDSVFASYSGAKGFLASVSGTITQLVSPPPVATTTTLTINPNANLITGEPITLTAVVKPASGTAIPTGSVTFDDPMVGKIAVPLDSTGTAVYKTVVPAPGNDSVFASYPGAKGFLASVSGTITRVVTAK
jgi:hypothetical protein